MSNSTRVGLFLFSLFLIGAVAQAGDPAPKSFAERNLRSIRQVDSAVMPPVDRQELLEEDARWELARRELFRWKAEGGTIPEALTALLDPDARAAYMGFSVQPGGELPADLLEAVERPTRVGYRMLTDLTPSNSGSWETLSTGGRVWRLQVHSARAQWLVLGFRTFRLQPGAMLHVYPPYCQGNPGCGDLWGPFTRNDANGQNQLWLPPIAGDRLVVELYWPGALRDVVPDLQLTTVSHGYKNILDPFDEISDAGSIDDDGAASPASGWCNVDVNCPEGNTCNNPEELRFCWQDEKRGVTHLLLFGSSWCSASLINNTAEDCRSYVLTARHCIDTASEAAGTTLRFNYERPACSSGTAPTGQLLGGSSLKATYSQTDMTLLQMNGSPPADYNAYFNGWSRSSLPAEMATCIHHPSGDAKKISHEFDPLIFGQPSGYGSDHWRVIDWDIGTTEGGSSGSPLFDPDHRIIGQLHGGLASCSNDAWDEYGRFDLSWNGAGSSSNRLKDWLDPRGDDPLVFDGLDHDVCLNPLPDLGYDEAFLTDTVGNQNGFPDAGETVELHVSVANLGAIAATAVSGELISDDPLVVVTRSQATWPDIAGGESEVTNGPGFEIAIDPARNCVDPIALTVMLDYAESEDTAQIDFQTPIGSPAIVEFYRDDMEDPDANGWTTTGVGAGGWIKTTADAASPVQSWFIEDIAERIDWQLNMPILADVPDDVRLIFQHRFNTEQNRDGGVLEYRTDDDPTWEDAGGLFVANGYNSAIDAGVPSTLAGRDAWTGDSGDWMQVELDLSTVASQPAVGSIELRWRYASDSANGDEGWYVDDVVAETTGLECLPPTPLEEATDFTIRREENGTYTLDWVAAQGATGYRLYRRALSEGEGGSWELLVDLGDTTSVNLPTLPDDSGFVIVPYNQFGEGPY